jgi:hypothetical protein
MFVSIFFQTALQFRKKELINSNLKHSNILINNKIKKMNKVFYGLVRTCVHTNKSEVISIANNTKELNKSAFDSLAANIGKKNIYNSFDMQVFDMRNYYFTRSEFISKEKKITKEIEEKCFTILKSLNETKEHYTDYGKYEIYKMEKVEKPKSKLSNLVESEDFHTSISAAIGSIVGVGIIFGVYSIL